MIITIGGIKGGSGKTTVATHLAILAATAGAKVLLVDADDQQTAAEFTSIRKEDYPLLPHYTCARLTDRAVRTEVLELADHYDHVIIDTGGRDSVSQRAALLVAHVLLVPFVPRSFDIWTLEKVAGLVDEMQLANPQLAAYVFLNRSDPEGQGPENTDAVLALQEMPSLHYLETPLRARKAFAQAASKGLSVTELTGPLVNHKASSEVITLFERTMTIAREEVSHVLS
jgi:chromosome partitioning protein